MLIAALIFIIGLVLAISPLLFRRKEYSENGAVGSFAMITAVYLMSEGRILDFITGNQFILGGMAYITLALIPVPLLIYMREIARSHYKKVFGAFYDRTFRGRSFGVYFADNRDRSVFSVITAHARTPDRNLSGQHLCAVDRKPQV